MKLRRRDTATPEVTKVKPLSIIEGIDLNGEEWISLLQGEGKKRGRFHKGIDFKRLLDGVSVLVMGDTNHDCLGIKTGIVQHLGKLKEAGVTDLLLEFPKDWQGKPFDEISMHTYIPHRTQDFLESASSAGFNLRFIDMPMKMREVIGDEKAVNHQRGIFMGAEIARFAREQIDRKAVAIVGFGHIQNEDEIPLQLSSTTHPTPHRIVGVVSEGQRTYFMGGTPVPFSLPIVAAVRAVSETGQREGYIDLEGLSSSQIKEPISGVIHFGSPPVESKIIIAEASKQNRLLPEGGAQETAIALSQQTKSLVPAQEGMRFPIFMDFQESIRELQRETSMGTSVGYWEHYNERHLLQFASQVGADNDLKIGQTVYLAAMLMSYARNNFKHNMNGMLLAAEFVPYRESPRRNAYFGFRSYDTFGYAIPQDIDYGSGFGTSTEISLQELEGRFGFQGALLSAPRELPKVEIKPREGDPVSLLKIGLLTLMATSNPDLLDIRYRSIGMRYPNDQNAGHRNSAICEIRLEDFELTDPEKRLLGLSSDLRTILNTNAHLTLSLDEQPEFNRRATVGKFLRRVFTPKRSALYRELDEFSAEQYRIDPKKPERLLNATKIAEHAVLKSRVELRKMNRQDLEEAFSKMRRMLGYEEKFISKAKALFDEYPYLLSRTNKRGDEIGETLIKLVGQFEHAKKICEEPIQN